MNSSSHMAPKDSQREFVEVWWEGGGLEPNPKLAKEPEGAAPVLLPRMAGTGWMSSGIQDVPAAGYW